MNKFRSIITKIVFGILMGLIILSFVVGGIGDAIRGINNFDIVKFKYVPNITIDEFYAEKKDLIKQIQQNSPTPLTEEKLAELNIDSEVLSRLISKRMFEHWIKDQKITVSDKLVASYIKSIPSFQSENKRFDLERFKLFLSKSSTSEQAFYDNYKLEVASSLLKNNVLEAATLPQMLFKIISDFLAEEREIDVVNIDLNSKNTNNSAVKYNDEDLVKFYNEHKNLFQQAEERNVNYLIIDDKVLQDQVTVTDQEAEEYFNENKSDFDEKVQFAKVKKDIIAKLTSYRKEEKLINLAKELEDMVAGGDKLSDIIAKYKVKLVNFAGDNTAFAGHNFLKHFHETIFSLQNGEVSYPLEIPGQKGFALIELTSLKESAVPDFKLVKAKVINEYLKDAFSTLNLAQIHRFANEAKADNFTNLATDLGLSLDKQVKLLRANLTDEKKWPPQLLTAAFALKKDTISPVIMWDNKAYVVKVNSVQIDNKKSKELLGANKENMTRYFKTSFLEDIINYYYNKNQPEIKMEMLGGK